MQNALKFAGRFCFLKAKGRIQKIPANAIKNHPEGRSLSKNFINKLCNFISNIQTVPNKIQEVGFSFQKSEFLRLISPNCINVTNSEEFSKNLNYFFFKKK